jgi:hypothetical protein
MGESLMLSYLVVLLLKLRGRFCCDMDVSSLPLCHIFLKAIATTSKEGSYALASGYRPRTKGGI